MNLASLVVFDRKGPDGSPAELRKAFEKAVRTSPKLAGCVLPLDGFEASPGWRYRHADTQAAWVGFALGVSFSERQAAAAEVSR